MRAIAISDAKANRLYWLGRYAERAYLSLHLLRRYFDLTLDGNPVDYKSYAKNLGPTVEGPLSFLIEVVYSSSIVAYKVLILEDKDKKLL